VTILKHHFINEEGNHISAYWYKDRYRYTVNTPKGIEYREITISPDIELICGPVDSIEGLESLLNEDSKLWPYREQQLKTKCIRCSKHHGAPRKEYNLAPICNRCLEAMEETNDTYSSGTVFYSINEDGSKGPVIKE
jgi:hypothetical protein